MRIENGLDVVAQFDQVTGVDEALGVGELWRVGADIGARRAVRADPKRAIDDVHLDAVAVPPDQVGGKTLAPVVDRETNAGLGRSIGMADRRMRKRGARPSSTAWSAISPDRLNKIVISNNQSYGTIRSYQEKAFPKRPCGTDLSNPDFAPRIRRAGLYDHERGAASRGRRGSNVGQGPRSDRSSI